MIALLEQAGPAVLRASWQAGVLAVAVAAPVAALGERIRRGGGLRFSESSSGGCFWLSRRRVRGARSTWFALCRREPQAQRPWRRPNGRRQSFRERTRRC